MTMTTVKTPESNAIKPLVSGITRAARVTFLLAAWFFAGGIALQVFYAGATLLVASDYLNQHRAFAHTLELVTFAIPIIGLFARLPRRMLLLSWLPLVLFMLQYVFIYAVPSLELPTSLRALHAVNALVIFWTSVHLARLSWHLVRAS